MVLSSFNFDVPEADLRVLCDCTSIGTDALKVVDAARQLGFAKTAKYTLSMKDLETVVANKLFPIVFIDLRPIEGFKEAHALVVISASDLAVQVYDPAQGERFVARQTFSTAWAMRHNLAIIVKK